MAALVIVFLADLILKGEKKHTTLSLLTGLLLVAQIAVCFTAEPAELSPDSTPPPQQRR